MTDASLDQPRPQRAWPRPDLATLAPFAALACLIVFGALVSPSFLTLDNLTNVLTRSAFIAVIGVGATFVIASGGIDLSVGSMAAFVAACMILLMNTGAGGGGAATLALGMALAVAVGAGCGLANGLVVTAGHLEPFIVTLGTMGIFRALTIWLAAGGSIAMKSQELRGLYRPVYFGNVAGVPVPILVILAIAALGSFVLHRTVFGRHVLAVGSSEDVARYSGVPVGRVRTIAYVVQGLCVAVAVLVYVPRLGAATATTGLLWELQAITAVVVGGTALRGGTGRVWGTVCGALILEIVGNIMVLSSFVSEYLIGAVQGAIIIVAMLVQRALLRRGPG